ncbi:MAG TPA: tRNA pseudouridine(38-40) synthase TruA, partial [Candidatus Methylomirabilis sp.]
LQARTSLHVPYALDLEAMTRGAAVLVGTHYFSAFRAGSCAARTPVRTVTQAAWRVAGEFWCFEVVGNAFLQHMVRIIVGTLLEVGGGKRDATDVSAILASCDRRRAGKTAAPQGLCLVAVEY